MFETLAATTGPAAVETLTDHLHLILADGVPTRVIHLGRRWRVIDSPTPLGASEQDWAPAITHPPLDWTGWRFTARDDDGETLVLDVADLGARGWRLLHAWR